MAETLVQVGSGLLQGTRQGHVSSWLGVPYARPPVGALRFMPPEPQLPWSGIRDATTLPPACPQPTFPLFSTKRLIGPELNEDCLYLNIWSPQADGSRRPVFFWIHGGAFMGGSAAPYNGAELAALGGIVVVTINYRLGVFGFANFENALSGTEIASNLGLRDQMQALRWVRQNIAAFGGDPERITIAGESTGSVSVALLMAADAARGHFHGAIMQSGSFNVIHSRDRSAEIGRAIIETLGCGSGSWSSSGSVRRGCR